MAEQWRKKMILSGGGADALRYTWYLASLKGWWLKNQSIFVVFKTTSNKTEVEWGCTATISPFG